MMPLRELVERYHALAEEFGRPVALSAFGLPPAETAGLFSSYDEDYHISRFFHFSEKPEADAAQNFLINGVAVTHVALDAEIQSIL